MVSAPFFSTLQATIELFDRHSAAVGGCYGSTLPRDEKLVQMTAVEAWLAAGIPLYTLDKSHGGCFLECPSEA